MSFNRLDYDKCAYAQRLDESTSPLDYLLFKGKYENEKDCKLSSNTNDASQLNKTVVENELYNLNRTSSLCSSNKYSALSKIDVPKHSPVRMCEHIHDLTPSGLEPITSSGLKPMDVTDLNPTGLKSNCLKKIE